MMRCKVGTSRRRAITFSSTDEYVEVRIDSIIELLRFTGVALAAVRMGMGGDDGAGEQETDDSSMEDAEDEGEVPDAQEETAPTDTEMEDESHDDEGTASQEDTGFERDVYLSYRSFRIQVA